MTKILEENEDKEDKKVILSFYESLGNERQRIDFIFKTHEEMTNWLKHQSSDIFSDDH